MFARKTCQIKLDTSTLCYIFNFCCYVKFLVFEKNICQKDMPNSLACPHEQIFNSF